MNLKLQNLSLNVIDTQGHASGPYTVVTVIDKIGMLGTGVSRKSEHDKSNPALGMSIARGRALKALMLKQSGKAARNWNMG